MWEKSKPLWAALAIALLVAGCGGAGAGGDGDPATAVPADALVYAEVVVRPEGSQREDALEAADKVLAAADPEDEIHKRLDLLFAELEVDYDRDLEPWLGERAGVWHRPAPSHNEFSVVLLGATDTDTAWDSLRAVLERNHKRFSERSYGDSAYLLDDLGVAFGIVGDFVAIGPEAAFKRTVDAAAGDSLAEAEKYEDAVEGLDDERLAHVWADTPGLLEFARSTDPDLEVFSGLMPLRDIPPLAASFSADGERLAVETRLRGRVAFGPLLASGSTPLLQELPGDAWVAAGSADAGEALRETIDGFAGAIGGLALRREVRSQTGLDLDRDLLDWVGDVAFFARGTTPETVDGGLVIQPTDEDRAADGLVRIVGAIQVASRERARPVDLEGADQAFELGLEGSPHPLVLARGSGLVVATLGRAAAEAALGDGDRLGDSDLYDEAEDLVGMEPGMLVSMPELIELASTDPEFGDVRPHLEAFTVIAAGMAADDDEASGRLAAGLR